MKLRVITPAHEHELEDVLHVRFDAPDGSRGVLPGHEAATSIVREGAIYVRIRVDKGDREIFVVTEGGMAVLGPREMSLVTSWAELADEMTTLADLVRARAAVRARIDADARAAGRRHEVALRRALAGLKREVTW